MLCQLAIRDIAIVETLELELASGLTVLTGETGAGKSILIDALGLVLGSRASAAQIRTGQPRAEVTAVFEAAADGPAAAWLAERELEEPGGECIVRRTVSAEGRSRAFINGRPVPVQSLRELGEHLVDIHGQHAHQSLLRPRAQRDLLDWFAGHDDLLSATAEAHRRWTALDAERLALGSSTRDRAVREDYLRFQIEELEQGMVGAAELEALHEEQQRLSHAEELLRAAGGAAHALAGDHDGALVSATAAVRRALEDARRLDPGIGGACDLLDGAMTGLEEAAAELRHYQDRIEVAPDRRDEVESRLERAHDLARRHRVAPEALEGLLDALAGELAASAESARRLAEVEAEIAAEIAEYTRLAGELTRGREAAAGKLAARVTENMATLGMEGGTFHAEVCPQPDGTPRAGGDDRVGLLVATNPGQPARELGQVASGGELSRLSLAIQVAGNRDRGIPTLIFDEVDTGIGGRLAEMVGRELKRLAESRQVLCVTHLPQVACHAHHHVHVSKSSGRKRTRTSATALAGDDRVQELARMLGGSDVTRQAVAHARELLERA